MNEYIEIISYTKNEMNKILNFFSQELLKIRVGKAIPSIIDKIKIPCYNSIKYLNQISTISIIDSMTLNIDPWDNSLIPQIEKSIINSNLGLIPINKGNKIKVRFPILSEETRVKLIKKIKSESEKNKIKIRNIRNLSNKRLKKIKKIEEDLLINIKNKIQKITNNYIIKIEKKFFLKKKEILKF
jgi:ribosome recycling factor